MVFLTQKLIYTIDISFTFVFGLFFEQNQLLTLHEKCPYSEFFWSVFNPGAGKYGLEKLQIRTLFKQCKLNHFRGFMRKRDLKFM